MRQRDAKVRRKLVDGPGRHVSMRLGLFQMQLGNLLETMFSALKNYIEKFGSQPTDKWSEKV